MSSLVASTPRPATIAWLVGLATLFIRFATTGAIENDHFVMLARAFQVLHGDWPVRDFEDPGQPLAYLISTAAAAAFGPTLLVSVVLCILFLSATTALVYLLVRRATASSLAGLLAVAAVLAIPPRMYNTTKAFVPVMAIWLAWRYADSPGRARLTLLAAWTAISFLLRHDYLVYVAAANVTLLTMCHATDRRTVVNTCGRYLALTLIFTSPWLVYVQWAEGLPAYFSSAFGFVGAEAARTAGAPPSGALFYVLLAVPVAGLCVSFRRPFGLLPAHVASASVLVLLLELVFLRDVLDARLPDVVPSLVIITGVIAGQLVSSALLNRAVLVSVAIGFAGALSLPFVAPNRMPTVADVLERPGRVARRLSDASPEIQPNPRLAPLVAYLTRCTSPDQRVLVSGFGPEIPVLADRAFAAGLPSWIPGYYQSPADVEHALARFRRENVAVAVMLEGSDAFVTAWPLLGRELTQRGWEAHPMPVVDDRVSVWLPHSTTQRSVDRDTGLPCPSS